MFTTIRVLIWHEFPSESSCTRVLSSSRCQGQAFIIPKQGHWGKDAEHWWFICASSFPDSTLLFLSLGKSYIPVQGLKKNTYHTENFKVTFCISFGYCYCYFPSISSQRPIGENKVSSLASLAFQVVPGPVMLFCNRIWLCEFLKIML